MSKRKKPLLFGLLLAIAMVSHVRAEAVYFLQAPYQVSPHQGLGPVLLVDETDLYEREMYEAIGAEFNLLIDNIDAYPEDGDTWFMGFEMKDPVLRLAEIVLSYNAAEDCMYFNGAPFFCNVRGAVEPGFIGRYRAYLLFYAQCVAEQDFALAFEFQHRGGQKVTLDGSPIYFRPTPFPIGEPILQLASNKLLPHIPKFPLYSAYPPEGRNPETKPDKTLFVIQVPDGIVTPSGSNCNATVPNVEVTVAAKVVSQSNGHLHFTGSTERGTGTFYNVATNESPITIDADTTSFTGTTSSTGALFSQYEAGDYGVSESLEVIAVDPYRGDSKESSIDLEIGLQGFVPLDTSGTIYTVRGSYDTDCDKQHNDSATGRKSHYVTLGMKTFAEALANEFFRVEGIKLSYNDASLEHGGFFDKGLPDRSIKCHITHRHGVDIDVNRSSLDYPKCPSTGKISIDCPSKDPAMVGHTMIDSLDNIAPILGAFRIPEGDPIHYRNQTTAISGR